MVDFMDKNTAFSVIVSVIYVRPKVANYNLKYPNRCSLFISYLKNDCSLEKAFVLNIDMSVMTMKSDWEIDIMVSSRTLGPT